MKSSNIGGQAVLEGIMMRNGAKYAVAVRKPDGEIEVQRAEYRSAIKWQKLTKIPFVRGVFNFVDSLVLGMKTLTYSASFFEDEEEEELVLSAEEAKKKEKQEELILTITMIFSVVLAMGLFMVLPYFISSLFGGIVKSRFLKTVIEALVRIGLFVAYILLISRMKDIQRVFMYHGAEHKCINCIEHGMELTAQNVKKSSKQHKRCGTSFLFFVVIVSVIVCFFITVESPVLRILLRIALLPVIAGISYELIKLAGSSENPIIGLLSKPGLAMQNLTTKEPEDDMIEVAIRAVEEVFDWKAYLKENFAWEEADDATESI
ncbi:MAG: DUF1385 domain-containing protein [Faecalimonas sp.]|nr:DUF1385 domain-containing protein [Faecalimonas sp.]